MGLNFMRSSSVFDPNTDQKNINPDPNNYKIIRHIEYNGHLLMEIKYLNCSNYEGYKILLFRNTIYQNVLKQKTIDPHFSSNYDYISPVARFEPTSSGWNMGLLLMKGISNDRSN